jgi:hypothetical protein
MSCACGKKQAWLFHRDDVLPEAVVANLYCPDCAKTVPWDGNRMIDDLGWWIEYDMEAARFYLTHRGIEADVTPEFIFDQEYCSWYGLSPLDLEENQRLHAELSSLKTADPLNFYQALKRNRMATVEQLKRTGWRKARKA